MGVSKIMICIVEEEIQLAAGLAQAIETFEQVPVLGTGSFGCTHINFLQEGYIEIHTFDINMA
jgi:hypothetical protein